MILASCLARSMDLSLSAHAPCLRTPPDAPFHLRAAQIVFSGRELENARALSYYGMAAGAEHQATLVLKTKGM